MTEKEIGSIPMSHEKGWAERFAEVMGDDLRARTLLERFADRYEALIDVETRTGPHDVEEAIRHDLLDLLKATKRYLGKPDG